MAGICSASRDVTHGDEAAGSQIGTECQCSQPAGITCYLTRRDCSGMIMQLPHSSCSQEAAFIVALYQKPSSAPCDNTSASHLFYQKAKHMSAAHD